MRAAAALSEHPLATHAFGECAGRLLELGGERPDLLALWATPPHAGALEDVVVASRRLLDPRLLVGCGAASVLGGAREVEGGAALAMLGVWGLQELEPLRWERRGGGLHHGLEGARGTALVFVDPFDVAAAEVLDELAVSAPQLSVVGGGVSGARHRGGNRLLLDGAEFRDGAVGVRFGEHEPVRALLSQGTRRVGPTMTVTAATGRCLSELAGRPAIDALRGVVADLDPEDQLLAAGSIEVGLVDRLGAGDPGSDQVRVVPVHGVDRDNGALVLGEEVVAGATACFHLRDPRGADADLCDLLGAHEGAAAALVCTSTARGSAYFGAPDHQPALLADLLPTAAVAGMSSTEELGVVGATAGVHHGATALVLFG